MSADDYGTRAIFKESEEIIGRRNSGVFFKRVLRVAEELGLMSGDHFTVDGTLVEAWASLKSLGRRDGKDKRDDDGDGVI